MEVKHSPAVPERITIRAFRAVDEPTTCEAFLAGHRQVLTDIGVTNILTAKEDWCTDPDAYVVVAEHESLGLVGGLRLQVDNGRTPLPMTTSIAHLDPRIVPTMERLSQRGNAELCGLWNAHCIAGRGLPNLLGFAAVSMANQIGINSMTGFVAHYTLRYALKVGFQIMEEIGDGGTFSYPIPDIKSIALVIPDVLLLDQAPYNYRRHIISLRLRPDQVRVESPAGRPMEVIYQLLLDRKILSLATYHMIAQEHLRHIA